MMVPGYFLAIAKRHVSGFCSLGEKELVAVENFLEKVLAKLGPLFGEYLVFEHGASDGLAANGSCISHAHFHLIPNAKALGPRLLTVLDFLPLERFCDLPQIGRGYAFLGFAGRYYYNSAVDLPGQWVRRQFASVLTDERCWDWAIERGEHELEQTLKTLRTAGLLNPDSFYEP